jgi:radical SAM superfamily enzyme YgiQ (UPF0313 family)
MRVILVRVQVDPYVWPRQRRPKLEHLGLAYLAACLRQKGHTAEILDAELQGLDPSQVMARLTEADCDLVGITMSDAVLARSAVEFLTQWELPRTRGRRLHVTAGGHFATRVAEKVLATVPNLSSVVLYEGEEALPELADRLAEDRDWRATPGIAYQADGCFRESDPRPQVADLDQLPFPARDTLPDLLSADPNAAVSVLSSRGCHRRCTFCGVRSFFGSWRPRSASNVVHELEALVRDFGVRRVGFQDDNFIGPGERGRERAGAIAEQMQKRRLGLRFHIMCSADTVSYDVFSRLVDAGLYAAFVGIESGSQTRLTAYRKGTVRQNIRALEVLDRLGLLQKCEIGFIMFDPDGDLKEIGENLAFLRDHVRFVTPGTFLNTRDDIYSCMDAGPSLSLPKPLQVLRELFTVIVVTTRDAYDRLQLGTPDHTESWRLGIIDLASHAVSSLSKLVERRNLTDEACQTLAAAVRSQAEALSSTMALPPTTTPAA